ncbi:DUF3035 domain-containing protein [Sulfitobacter aestuarii]|uniref:DUF3035 domain-containing protein n=1 Tax=Sulfitobacter aestuarii TaxID=2161676 RepID=A0ABW5U2R3_9RHOB
MRRLAAIALIPVLLAGCSNQGLRTLNNPAAGPDEFMVSPVKALEAPADYGSLPVPTPGQGNLTDRSALQEGVIAFGGTPQSGAGPVPAQDTALVRHAGRLGVDPAIRGDLAQRDADFRRGRARLTQFRIVPVDRYNQVYRRQALDAEREADRWRRAGARTPSAPPAE